MTARPCQESRQCKFAAWCCSSGYCMKDEPPKWSVRHAGAAQDVYAALDSDIPSSLRSQPLRAAYFAYSRAHQADLPLAEAVRQAQAALHKAQEARDRKGATGT